MSNPFELGVLYTEHSRMKARTPVASLWSYETCSRGRGRRSVTVNLDGSHEYWLERSDPLLNTILPGTGVSLIVNFGDLWAAGPSLATSCLLPRVCVVGPVTQARILRVGGSVRAVGAGFLPTRKVDLVPCHRHAQVVRYDATSRNRTFPERPFESSALCSD